MMSYALPLPRITGSAVLAGIITAGLLWIMQDLIRHEGPIPDLVPTGSRLTILRLPEPEERVDDEPPELIEVLPPPEIRIKPSEGTFEDSVGIEMFDAPTLDGGVIIGPGGLPDGEMLPIVKVAPTYPSRAVTRAIEGYVLMEFTVDESGAVRDPRILESQPSGIFDRSAIRAVLRFKYKPRVLDGAAVQVEGVLHRLVFELNGA